MMDDEPMREPFFKPVLRALAPLLLWAVHFFVCYVISAERRLLLAVLSAGALAVCAWLLWREWAVLDERASLREWSAAGGAVLALVGIAWTIVPIVLLVR